MCCILLGTQRRRRGTEGLEHTDIPRLPEAAGYGRRQVNTSLERMINIASQCSLKLPPNHVLINRIANSLVFLYLAASAGVR